MEQDMGVLTKLVREAFSGMGAGKFKPCIIHNKELDILIIVEKDCSYTEEQSPGSNIAILRKNHGDDAGKVVGVIVYQWSKWPKNI